MGRPCHPPRARCSNAAAVDHFAFLAASETAFRELRRRVESEGPDGDVRDMKTAWTRRPSIQTGFTPRSSGVARTPDADTLERADWTTVDLT